VIRHGLIMLFALFSSPLYANPARPLASQATRSYEEGDFAAAAEGFSQAAAEAEETRLDPAVARYNQANALLADGREGEAADRYTEALRTTNLDLQTRIYFNRGIAIAHSIDPITDPEQVGPARERLLEAMDMFEKAILLDAADRDAKKNYELIHRQRMDMETELGKSFFEQAEAQLREFQAGDAKENYQQAKLQFDYILNKVAPDHAESREYLERIAERLDMLQKAVDDARRDLDTAHQQINRYQYLAAARILSAETDSRKYALDMEPDLKKKYEEATQKSAEVLQIIQELSKLGPRV
jgi:hypothetical protein